MVYSDSTRFSLDDIEAPLFLVGSPDKEPEGAKLEVTRLDSRGLRGV